MRGLLGKRDVDGGEGGGTGTGIWGVGRGAECTVMAGVCVGKVGVRVRGRQQLRWCQQLDQQQQGVQCVVVNLKPLRITSSVAHQTA